MRIAITGGTGFVGRSVAGRLRAEGHIVCELAMTVPLIAVAQVHILAEGVVEASPAAEPPPADLAPATPFSADSIRAGLPDAEGFGCRDLRWCRG
jgi:NADH dehydrogenase